MRVKTYLLLPLLLAAAMPLIACQRVVADEWLPRYVIAVDQANDNEMKDHIEPGMSEAEVLAKLAGRVRPSGNKAFEVIENARPVGSVRTKLYFRDGELKAIIRSGEYWLPLLF